KCLYEIWEPTLHHVQPVEHHVRKPQHVWKVLEEEDDGIDLDVYDIGAIDEGDFIFKWALFLDNLATFNTDTKMEQERSHHLLCCLEAGSSFLNTKTASNQLESNTTMCYLL
ncbi:hypothetical protein ACJX0J_030311, partial [Zea mays]